MKYVALKLGVEYNFFPVICEVVGRIKRIIVSTLLKLSKCLIIYEIQKHVINVIKGIVCLESIEKINGNNDMRNTTFPLGTSISNKLIGMIGVAS